MAEIHVEPKKQTSNTVWIWIVLVLILAVVIYFLATRNTTAETTAPPANTTGSLHSEMFSKIATVQEHSTVMYIY